jgi:phosphosulfolactate synthase (CoM biosynthesis protein A)
VDIDSMPTRRIELIIIDDDDDDEEEDIQGITGFNQEGIDAKKEFGEPKTDQENQTESSNTTVNEINNNVVDRSKSMDIDIGSNSNTHSLISKGPIPLDVEDKQDTTSFNSEGTDAKTEVSETKVDQEKQTKSSNRIDDAVSLVDLLTHDQITKHISSFGEQSNQVRTPTSCVFNFIVLFRHYCYEPTIP